MNIETLPETVPVVDGAITVLGKTYRLADMTPIHRPTLITHGPLVFWDYFEMPFPGAEAQGVCFRVTHAGQRARVGVITT